MQCSKHRVAVTFYSTSVDPLAKPNPDAPLPKVFSERARQRDRTLLAEDSNTLFRAFRERRLFHEPPGAFRKFSDWFSNRSMGQLLGTIGAVLLGIVLILLAGIFGAILVAFLLSIGAVKARRRKITGGSMPMRIEHVFSRSGLRLEPAIDLYMTGATGRDVAEAIYLEYRERTRWTRFVIGTITSLPLFFIWLGMVLSTEFDGGAAVAVSVLMGTIATFVWMMVRLAFASGIKRAHRLLYHTVIKSWDQRTDTGRASMRDFEQAVIAMLLLGVGSIPGLLGCIGIGIFLQEIMKQSVAIAWNLGAAFWLATYCVIAEIAYRRMLPKNIALVESVWPEADFAYQNFMSSIVFEDPDGARWAEWRYRQLNPGLYAMQATAPQAPRVPVGAAPADASPSIPPGEPGVGFAPPPGAFVPQTPLVAAMQPSMPDPAIPLPPRVPPPPMPPPPVVRSELPPPID